MNPFRYRKTLTVLALLLVLAATYWLMNARCFQLVGELVCRGDGTRAQVALTFDDAPVPQTTETVLATLAEKQVRGTFFAIGAQMAAQPQLAQRIVAAGHQLANHSWSHPRFLLKSPAFIAREIDDTEAQIRAAGHRGKAYFRPPYGKKLLGLPWALARRGITTVMWDVDADRFRAQGVEAMVAQTVAAARPGSIILLHPFCADECATDRAALPLIIDGLRARGFALVTVAELLEGTPATPPTHLHTP